MAARISALPAWRSRTARSSACSRAIVSSRSVKPELEPLLKLGDRMLKIGYHVLGKRGHSLKSISPVPAANVIRPLNSI